MASSDPEAPPLYDPNYLSDPDGYDIGVLVEGVRIARRIAATEPAASWIARESFPGPDVTSVDDLAEIIRKTHHTVYHPVGTCKIGAASDPLAVVDSELCVRGVTGLRVADASVFPSITAVNPVITVLMVGERAADLVAAR